MPYGSVELLRALSIHNLIRSRLGSRGISNFLSLPSVDLLALIIDRKWRKNATNIYLRILTGAYDADLNL